MSSSATGRHRGTRHRLGTFAVSAGFVGGFTATVTPTQAEPPAAPARSCPSGINSSDFASSADLERLNATVAGSGTRFTASLEHERLLNWLGAELRFIPGMQVRQESYSLNRWLPTRRAARQTRPRPGRSRTAGPGRPGSDPLAHHRGSSGEHPAHRAPRRHGTSRLCPSGRVAESGPRGRAPRGARRADGAHPVRRPGCGVTLPHPGPGRRGGHQVRPALPHHRRTACRGHRRRSPCPSPASGWASTRPNGSSGRQLAAPRRGSASSPRSPRPALVRSSPRCPEAARSETCWSPAPPATPGCRRTATLPCWRWLAPSPRSLASAAPRPWSSYTSGRLHRSREGSKMYAELLGATWETEDAGFVFVVEHLGTREILPVKRKDGPGHRLQFTGKGGPYAFFAPTESPALSTAMVRAVQGRDLSRTAVLRGQNVPDSARLPAQCSFGGIGTSFHSRLIPTIGGISGPWSLWAPSFGRRAMDPGRMRHQVLAIGDAIISLSGQSRRAISGLFPAERAARFAGAPTRDLAHPKENGPT